MSLNIYTSDSYQTLQTASKTITEEVQKIHTQSSKSGLSVTELKSLKREIKTSRETIDALGKQIHAAMVAVPNRENYSMPDFYQLMGFTQFANMSPSIKKANLFLLDQAEKNINKELSEKKKIGSSRLSPIPEEPGI